MDKQLIEIRKRTISKAQRCALSLIKAKCITKQHNNKSAAEMTWPKDNMFVWYRSQQM